MARIRIFNYLSSKDVIHLDSSDSEPIFEMRSVRRSRKNFIQSDSESNETGIVLETSDDNNYRDKIQKNSNNRIISVAGTSGNKSNRIIEENNSTINNHDICSKKNSSYIHLSNSNKVIKKPRTLFYKSKKRRSLSSDYDTDVSSLISKSFDSKILRNNKEINDPCSKDFIFNASSTELDSPIQNKKTVSDFQTIIMDGTEKIKDKLVKFILRTNNLQSKFFSRELMTKQDAEDAIFVFSSVIHKIKGEMVELEEELKNAYVQIGKGNINFQDNETSSNLNEDKNEILRKKYKSTKNSSPSTTKMESTKNSNNKHDSRRDSIEKQQIGKQIETKIDLTLQSENSEQYNEVQALLSSTKVKLLELHHSVSKEEEEEEVFVPQKKSTTPTISSIQDTIDERLRDIVSTIMSNKQSRLKRAQTPMPEPRNSDSEDTVIISLHKEDNHKSEKENNIIDVQETTQTTTVSKNAVPLEKLNVNISDISMSVSSESQNSVFTDKSNVTSPDEEKSKRRRFIVNYEEDSDSEDSVVNKRIHKMRKVRTKTDNKLNMLCQVELRKLENCRK